MLCKRIYSWADQEGILPECQNGFRLKRGCTDNLFIAQTAIQEHTRIRNNVLYGTFVDFKQAFDCIRHDLLWAKLIRIGLPISTVRVLASLYSKANVRVKTNVGTTGQIDINNGVLQGDCLSPLLVSLFTSDFQKFLEDMGVSGVGIGHDFEVTVLFFADDLKIFSGNITQVQRAVSALEDYCNLNALRINPVWSN